MRKNLLRQVPEELVLLLVLLLVLVVALGLSVNAAVALSIGSRDVLWPVSLSAQFVGFFYFTAGLASLAGVIAVFPLLGKALALSDQTDGAPADRSALILPGGETATRPLPFVAGAVVAGLYIDLVIVFYSFHYKTLYVWIFSVLALLCAGVACLTIPAIWKYLGRGLKTIGILLTTLATVVQFWYQSVYVPENTQVGIDYGLDLGSVVRSGGDSLVPVNLTMEDESPVTALTLGSMVVVSGINYPSGNSTFLQAIHPIDDDSFLFPNDTYSSAFLVVITRPGIDALHLKITLYYARTTGLTLGNALVPTRKQLRPCPDEKQSEWSIKESNLRTFTEGPQTLYSDWCADSKISGGPFVKVEPGTRESRAAQNAMKSQVNMLYRDYTIPIGGDSRP